MHRSCCLSVTVFYIECYLCTHSLRSFRPLDFYFKITRCEYVIVNQKVRH